MQSKENGRPGAAVAMAFLIACAIMAGGCVSGNIVVNGKSIPELGIKAEVERRLVIIGKSNAGELKGERGVKLRAETERQVTTDFIKAELMRQKAQKMGVKLSPSDVNRRLEEERQRLGSDKFEKQLKSQGLTLDQYKKMVEEKALVDELGKKVSEGVKVSTDEAESYYLMHKDLFGKTLMAHVQDILADNESEADVIASDAKQGTDFTTLAKSFSRDAATASNGGDLGWIEKGTMEPALEEAVFALQPGQVSGVVRASNGFHVVKVLERREASTPSFSEVAGQAVEMLTSSRKEEVFSDWLRTTYANAKVNVDGIGKWDPALGMVVQK